MKHFMEDRRRSSAWNGDMVVAVAETIARHVASYGPDDKGSGRRTSKSPPAKPSGQLECVLAA